MEKILKELFLNSDFKDSYTSDDFLLYEKENKEYFFVSSFEEHEIKNFFRNEKTNSIIQKQNNLYEKKESIKKNSTLIIFVKTNNLKEFFEAHKNEVYRIEEDAYHFRKLVIAYTDNSIKQINEAETKESRIFTVLKDSNRMKAFEKELYEDEEYFLVMQLFVKLSFLKFEMDDKEFLPIRTKITNNLKNEGLYELHRRINEWISDRYSNSSEEERYYQNLQEAFNNIEKDEDILLEFLDEWGGIENQN